MPSDQEIKQAYSRILETHRQEARAECVSPEAILSLVEGSEDEVTRLETLDHTMACPHCREDFELLRGLARSRPEEKRTTRSWLNFTPEKLAWAASLVLALGLGSIWLTSQGPGPDVVMRGDGAEVGLVSPVSGGVLEKGMAFVWNSFPEAFAYDLEVIGADGEIVYRASTADTTITAEDSPSWAGAGGLSWWVTARTGDGSRIASPMRPLGALRR